MSEVIVWGAVVVLIACLVAMGGILVSIYQMLKRGPFNPK